MLNLRKETTPSKGGTITYSVLQIYVGRDLRSTKQSANTNLTTKTRFTNLLFARALHKCAVWCSGFFHCGFQTSVSFAFLLRVMVKQFNFHIQICQSKLKNVKAFISIMFL